MRPSMEYIILRTALLLGERSTCSARAKVGAVLVDVNNRIVATGYNGAPRGVAHCDDVGCSLDSDGHCLRAIHAEVNALLSCAENGVSTKGLVLYCTYCPCFRCMNMLYQAGIAKVFYIYVHGTIHILGGMPAIQVDWDAAHF